MAFEKNITILSIVMLIATVGLLVLGYMAYGRWVEAKQIELEEIRIVELVPWGEDEEDSDDITNMKGK